MEPTIKRECLIVGATNTPWLSLSTNFCSATLPDTMNTTSDWIPLLTIIVGLKQGVVHSIFMCVFRDVWNVLKQLATDNQWKVLCIFNAHYTQLLLSSIMDVMSKLTLLLKTTSLSVQALNNYLKFASCICTRLLNLVYIGASTSSIAIAHLSLINTSTIKIFSYLLMMKYKHTNKYVRM